MNLRIFVIDDEPCIAETFRWHLSDQGHEVICGTEPTACKIYQGGVCDHDDPCGDILFVDMYMPKMNGLEFIEHMEKKGCKGVTRNKVIMTSSIENVDIQRGIALGCLVIQKPITLAQIDALIDEIKKNIPPDRKLADLG
jgi:CheY-like chemotaxis protein